MAAYQLWHWKVHLDLEGVRDARQLERLPQDEQEAWQALWREVDEVLALHKAPVDEK